MESGDSDGMTHMPSSKPTKTGGKAKAAQRKSTAKMPTQGHKRKPDDEDDTANKKRKPSAKEKTKPSDTKPPESRNLKFEVIEEQMLSLEDRPMRTDEQKEASLRLGKKKNKSYALEDPYMGRVSAEAHSVIPTPKMRPQRGLPGSQESKKGVKPSPSAEQELQDLLSLANAKVFKDQPSLLDDTSRFSLAWPAHVEPFEAKKASQKKLNGLDSARPPISTIDGIFDDMAVNATGMHLEEALPPFDLRIATMCSGTEAPLLGMGLLKQALLRQDKTHLNIRHIFSAEKEPFKQAYIERNFSPPILFRDVEDFHSEADAQTAYGGTARQPSDVHILVAGSSCVDYSTLNQKRKLDFDHEGQSFRTLDGIQAYVGRARPNIVILENVKKAPWKKMKFFLENVGYACNHVLVDTKNFYLPQTRERGYLIGLDTMNMPEGFKIEVALSEWSSLMWDFQRRANAPFSDFIYDDDDPELHAAKVDADSIDTTSSSMRWDACRHRYARLRIEKLLGSKRPMTHWQDNGSCKFPDFGWMKWGKSQRERIWDTLDIQYLRHAGERDYDINYKIRWLELSQNVDRDTDTRRWGIVSCLTPSGIPYLTTRGGPVSGGESLLLQGIPKYALSLTKETSRQLQDLAGNAMSVPVVTAAILSGILAVRHGMTKGGNDCNYFANFAEHDKQNGSPYAIMVEAPVASSLEQLLGDLQNDSGTIVPVGSMLELGADQILDRASRAMQFCKCEGTSDKKEVIFQICKSCGHTTCKTCGQNPIHQYRDITEQISESRILPAAFITLITEALPTILHFGFAAGVGLASYPEPMGKHRSCTQEFQQASKVAFHSTVYFKHVKRGHFWKITFEGPYSRLELRISRKCNPSRISASEFFGRQVVECHWLLFAKAPATKATTPQHESEVGETDAGGTLREALQHPIARMTPHNTLLDGKWEMMHYSRVNLDIKMANGDQVPAWERSIGLLDDKFRDLNRATALKVSVVPGFQSSEAKEAGNALTGIYELRPQCGTANANLHVRRQTVDQSGPPMFFFLEPEQLKNEIYDSFIFSTTNYRRGYQEYRMIQAQVEEGWRPYHLSTASIEPQDSTVLKELPKSAKIGSKEPPKSKATGSKKQRKPKENALYLRGNSSIATIQNWISCDALSMNVPAAMNDQRYWLSSHLDVKLSNETVCGLASPLMLIRLPIETYKCSNWKPGRQFPIDMAGRAATLDPFHWLIERAVRQALVKHSGSQNVLIETLPREPCLKCAPKSSSVEFQTVVERKPNKDFAADTSPAAAVGAKKPTGKTEECLEFRVNEKVKAMEVKTEATEYEKTLKDRPLPISAVVHCHENSALLEINLNIPTLCHRVLAKLSSSQDLHLSQPTVKWSLNKDHGHEKPPKFQVKSFFNNSNETASAKPKRFARQLWPEQGQALTWMVRQEVDPCEWKEKEREEISVPVLGCRIDVEAHILKKVRGGVLADEVGGGKTTTSLALIAEMLEVQKDEPMRQVTGSVSLDATLILVPAGIIAQWREEMEVCFKNTNVQWAVVKTTRDLLKLKLPALQKQDIILASWGILDGPDYWNALEKLSGTSNMPLKPGRALHLWLHKALAQLGRREGLHEQHFKTRIDPDSLFHAFTFRRIIIDEYSYLKGHSFLAALELKASAMWLLSGTPPVSNFDALNTTAKLLKTRLTSEDEKDGCFSFVTAGPRLSTDWTDAEQFQWYNNDRSPAWLKARNELVNDFVEKFVRKNPSDAAKKIQRLSHYELSTLSAREQFVYFQVYQRLMSQSVKFKTKLPKKEAFARLSQGKRLDMTVCVSENLEDALLSCCTEVNTIYNNGLTVNDEARSTISKLIGEIYQNLRECFAYEEARDQKVAYVLKNAKANPHFLSFKLRVKNNDVGDKSVAELIDRLMLVAFDNKQMPTEPYMQRADTEVLVETEEEPEPEDADSDDDEPEDDETKALTDEQKFGVGATKSKKGKTYTAAYVDNFHRSKEAWPDFMSEIFGEEPLTLDQKARKAKQQKFRRADFGVRNDQEKARSEDMNTVVIGIIAEVRRLRFHQNVDLIVRNKPLPACSGCGMDDQSLAKLFLLGICGHVACQQCLHNVEGRKSNPDGCLDTCCSAPGLPHHLIEAKRFRQGHSPTATISGSKMDAVISKIASIPKTDGILIFVQFPRVLKALTDALNDKMIPCLDAASCNSSSASDAKIEKFRKGHNDNDNDANVLILPIDSVNAAGW
jgi:site-specific DNA-cytosine methylase/serine/threonine protein kinase